MAKNEKIPLVNDGDEVGRSEEPLIESASGAGCEVAIASDRNRSTENECEMIECVDRAPAAVVVDDAVYIDRT